jgi:hypothetical protein
LERRWTVDSADRPIVVKVELLDPALKEHYGPTMSMSREHAVLGEEKGKWKIIREQTYDTRVMEPSRPGGSLTYEDMFKRHPSTRRGKKKKVAWVQDLSRMGGAELSNREVVRIGMDCGFDISVLTPKNDRAHLSKILSSTDIIILNNIFEFSPSHMNAMLKAIYMDKVPYIKYEHDHRELSRPEFSKKLFLGSVLNVFLSPAHRENYRQVLGCDGACFPLAIDVDLFHLIPSIERKANTALICNVRNFKTWNNLQAYITAHPEIAFTILSDKGVPVHGNNVKVSSFVPYEKMPEVYSAHQYLVHILDGWGANERVVWEAALCGCEVVTNKMVGARSWGTEGFNVNLTNGKVIRDWLEKAPFLFWREVDDQMSCVKTVPEFQEAVC